MVAEDSLFKAPTETVDSTDEDEGGVSVSQEQLGNCQISGFAGE